MIIIMIIFGSRCNIIVTVILVLCFYTLCGQAVVELFVLSSAAEKGVVVVLSQ